MPPNTKHDAYAVWLYNSPTDSHILGFVNPGVGTNGRLSTAGALPTNASHFKQLIVTLETQSNPKRPGKIILQGTLTLCLARRGSRRRSARARRAPRRASPCVARRSRNPPVRE